MSVKATPSLSDIQMDMVRLTAFIEGLSVLIYAADGDRKDPETKRAANCIAPFSEKLAEIASEITNRLDEYESGTRNPEAMS